MTPAQVETEAQHTLLFSAIIPTWNEARLLPSLITQLQDFECVSEIIVADNYSDDGTPQIARQLGCSVIPGGLPATGRNAGALVAREAVFLFIDADAIVSAAVMTAVSNAFCDHEVNLMHLRLTPLSTRRFIRLCYRVMDGYFAMCDKMHVPQGVGTLIAVRREAFNAVHGFDETVRAGEDAYFIRQIGRRVGGVRYERCAQVKVSARRFSIEIPTVFVLKTLMWTVLRLMGSRRSVIGYRWKRYD